METLLKMSHKYYTQRMLQMAITGTIKIFVVVWTPQVMIIDEIYFDNESWCSLKKRFQNIMSIF